MQTRDSSFNAPRNVKLSAARICADLRAFVARGGVIERLGPTPLRGASTAPIPTEKGGKK